MVGFLAWLMSVIAKTFPLPIVPQLDMNIPSSRFAGGEST